MQAGLGEVKRVGLIADDKSAQVFASAVPFPNRATDGGCTLEATLVTPNAEAVMLSATGFKPGVTLNIEMNSEGEKQHPSGKTDATGSRVGGPAVQERAHEGSRAGIGSLG